MHRDLKSRSTSKSEKDGRDFKKFIKDDLLNIRKIRNYCTSNPRIDNLMRSVINKHPFQDIVVVLYLFFAVGLFDIGKSHFWVVVANLAVAFCKFYPSRPMCVLVQKLTISVDTLSQWSDGLLKPKDLLSTIEACNP